MAAVAGAGGGGGDEMLPLLLRPRSRRIALSDLTNLSSATSDIKAKGKARTERKRSPGSSTSSIGSSTNPRIPMHPPPPPPPSAQGHVAGIQGKDKATRELQTSAAHRNKIQNISKPKVKTGGVLPGPSSPSVNTRKITRKEQPLCTSSKTKVKTGGDVLPAASTPPSKKTMKITRKEQVHMETEPLISPLYASSRTKVKTVYGESSLPSKKTRKVTSSSSSRAEEEDDEMSWDEGPSKEFIEERRAYFAEVDAVELVEEFVSSGSDAE